MWRYSCWPCWRWKTQESQNKLGKTQSRGQRSVKQRKERGTDKWSWDKLWVFLTRPKPDFQSFLFLSSATLTSRPRHRVMRLWTTPRRIPAGVGGEDLAGHEATPYVPPSPSPHVESLWQLSSTPVLTWWSSVFPPRLTSPRRNRLWSLSHIWPQVIRHQVHKGGSCSLLLSTKILLLVSSNQARYNYLYCCSTEYLWHRVDVTVTVASQLVFVCLLVMINWIYLGFWTVGRTNKMIKIGIFRKWWQ